MSVLNPNMTGAEKKAAGILKIAAKNADWIAEASHVVKTKMPKLFKFTAEDLRDFLCDNEVDPPKHHNAWGALMHTLVRDGLAFDTEESRLAKRASAHSRRLPVYVRL